MIYTFHLFWPLYSVIMFLSHLITLYCSINWSHPSIITRCALKLECIKHSIIKGILITLNDYSFILSPDAKYNKTTTLSFIHLSNAFLPPIVLYFLMWTWVDATRIRLWIWPNWIVMGSLSNCWMHSSPYWNNPLSCWEVHWTGRLLVVLKTGR